MHPRHAHPRLSNSGALRKDDGSSVTLSQSFHPGRVFRRFVSELPRGLVRAIKLEGGRVMFNSPDCEIVSRDCEGRSFKMDDCNHIRQKGTD
ncbi:hypothetical protein AVEN_234902-1 [Araneus ventricosus]|uniref:Uncharacterized protein n=1 Tax=Araneus ventricosus TaxID=182803 RepID=A0A4Y2H7F9_ARAVE|nr:hypothetical protein AVEN_234902-1 [Araneus ventricosus]